MSAIQTKRAAAGARDQPRAQDQYNWKDVCLADGAALASAGTAKRPHSNYDSSTKV